MIPCGGAAHRVQVYGRHPTDAGCGLHEYPLTALLETHHYFLCLHFYPINNVSVSTRVGAKWNICAGIVLYVRLQYTMQATHVGDVPCSHDKMWIIMMVRMIRVTHSIWAKVIAIYTKNNILRKK